MSITGAAAVSYLPVNILNTSSIMSPRFRLKCNVVKLHILSRSIFIFFQFRQNFGSPFLYPVYSHVQLDHLIYHCGYRKGKGELDRLCDLRKALLYSAAWARFEPATSRQSAISLIYIGVHYSVTMNYF